MRRLTFTLALLVMALTAAWADNVAIDETNFPDDKFRAYVSDEFDTDKDGQLSDDEIAAATYITVYYSGIESLKGIEYFTALTNLECFSNQLTELDLSYNTALEHLDCSDNGITELDLSNNKALTELYCNGNQLTKLDLSNNTALEKLVCYVNKLTGLDLSNNTALTGLSCYGNQITKLDLSNNTALGQLSCYGNKLTKLDLSNNKALTSLDCNGNQLTKLDLSNNTALTVLNCDNTQLTKLDLSNNTALTGLSCQKNQLTELDLSNNTELAYAYCTDNQLTGLNVSKNTKLSQLLCNNNHITAIDLSNNTELIYIAFEKNQLVALDLSKNTKLSYVLYDGNERNMGEVDFNGFTVEGLDMTRVSNVSGATVVDGKFVPTDNTVTKISYTYDTQHVMKGITFRLKVTPVSTAPSAEEALVALMGDVKYVSSYYNVSVNKDGDIIYENVDDDITRNITELFTISLNDDGNYVTNVLMNIQFIFYVEDQKVTKIEAYDKNKLYITFLPEQETPTAIDAPAAEKAQKAVKVIENGEIVIIRNGERFNLRGAKIE